MRRLSLLTLASFIAFFSHYLSGQTAQPADNPTKHNIIIFVADGLRHGSVNATDTPTLWRVRQEGVHFKNSHSLFPTFTTANASAIATGHYLGDTGDFSNVIWTKYLLFSSGNFGRTEGASVTPFLEDDQIIGDLDDHYQGNYLHETTLLQAARDKGYQTAVVGKLGPAAIQDVEELSPRNHEFPIPADVILDDSTGRFFPANSTHNAAPPLSQTMLDAFNKKLSPVVPDRTNGCAKNDSCSNASTHTTAANWGQQQYMVDAVTHAILPTLKARPPFLLVFWSRDPDGTQHNQADSAGADSAPGANDGLVPGINGPTSKKALRNCDDDLRQLFAYLHDNKLEETTDVIITSDHGFATISRSDVDSQKEKTKSPSVQNGVLPNGFLAIDLARHFGYTIFDPDAPEPKGPGGSSFRRIDIAKGEHLTRGNALLGPEVHSSDGSDARIIVAANGGSDLIYVPNGDKGTVREVVKFLSTTDYLGGLFVNDELGPFDGTLPMSAIGLMGQTPLPKPSIVVSFKVFYLALGDLQSGVQVSDTYLQQGQGMHGGFGRESTFNNMAAIGPDFKPNFADDTPVSNADIAPTLAKIIGIELPSHGTLRGRVMAEALTTASSSVASEKAVSVSKELAGKVTILEYQKADGRLYFDRACFVVPTKGRLDCDAN
ncbi:MAG TPA: alkaline phosphatase family protein [Candidatus Binatia bacterium]|nr:alkaline phosphatase family protein [Candidatus Binatia bacterium]